MNRIQTISGVVPPAVAEATVMTVWPSVASTGLGLYLSMRLPWAFKRYRLTNRRVAIERGVNPRVEQFVDLDRFDAIDLVVKPGQEWYAAGDLVFRRGPIETLRLPGVSRPESFRRVCLEARQAYVSVAAAQPEAVGAA